jgi:hypothetical protein
MEMWTEIRRKVLVEGASRRSIRRDYRISAEALEKILLYPVLARFSRTVLAPTPSALAIASSCSQDRDCGSTGCFQISVMLGTCLAHDTIPVTPTLEYLDTSLPGHRGDLGARRNLYPRAGAARRGCDGHDVDDACATVQQCQEPARG